MLCFHNELTEEKKNMAVMKDTIIFKRRNHALLSTNTDPMEEDSGLNGNKNGKQLCHENNRLMKERKTMMFSGKPSLRNVDGLCPPIPNVLE